MAELSKARANAVEALQAMSVLVAASAIIMWSLSDNLALTLGLGAVGIVLALTPLALAQRWANRERTVRVNYKFTPARLRVLRQLIPPDVYEALAESLKDKGLESSEEVRKVVFDLVGGERAKWVINTILVHTRVPPQGATDEEGVGPGVTGDSSDTPVRAIAPQPRPAD